MVHLATADTQILCQLHHLNLFTYAISSVYGLYVAWIYSWSMKYLMVIVFDLRGLNLRTGKVKYGPKNNGEESWKEERGWTKQKWKWHGIKG